MIVTLEEVIQYLRIDPTDLEEHDKKEIDNMRIAQEISLYNQTGVKFDNTNELAQLYINMCVSESYDNRGTKDKTTERESFMKESILFQLRTCYDPTEEVTHESRRV